MCEPTLASKYDRLSSRCETMQIDPAVAVIDILETPPARTFVVREIGVRQPSLAL